MFIVYGYEREVKRRLSLRLPAHAVDDVAHDALVRAIAAAFDSTSVGDFRSWLHTVVDRATVDFFRRAKRRQKSRASRASTRVRTTSGAPSRRLTARPARSSCGSSSRRCSRASTRISGS
ncbi:MAG: sigma factor [Solirubrobacteraceae bacterium]